MNHKELIKTAKLLFLLLFFIAFCIIYGNMVYGYAPTCDEQWQVNIEQWRAIEQLQDDVAELDCACSGGGPNSQHIQKMIDENLVMVNERIDWLERVVHWLHHPQMRFDMWKGAMTAVLSGEPVNGDGWRCYHNGECLEVR